LGRLVSYKRVDLLVAVATQLGLPTVIAGTGPEKRRLERMAGPTVRFVGEVSESEAGCLLEQCVAFVFCGQEDFGIAVVEAQAHGAPIVALRAGGVPETVLENATGVLFDQPTPGDLSNAIRRALRRQWDEQVIRHHARTFSAERFRAEFGRLVDSALGGETW
jgi:glycosyltransferase involved in cell wall biosynthesis